ncbi:uncharacterized protein PHACADRAFT_202931 [Phanerochaete carnosa HHB-10118-sp]|uniref:Uncharacterized protein n=1 Tax=Phanerochaete carnosa (strain HHB-10118-sp) TaxID=650164 RepID=K5VP69_PHACS|nr:uncharacterized protein PHACADRAFT_202931 [Phanerochaete carnosa HHB-10118-sp]EKM48349.1 hypothetical protein PHACADRAFT_202931 [Phanerochaete carnosa HHB-10118-sp]
MPLRLLPANTVASYDALSPPTTRGDAPIRPVPRHLETVGCTDQEGPQYDDQLVARTLASEATLTAPSQTHAQNLALPRTIYIDRDDFGLSIRKITSALHQTRLLASGDGPGHRDRARRLKASSQRRIQGTYPVYPEQVPSGVRHHRRPAAAQPYFKADINAHSLNIVRGVMVEVGFWPLAAASEQLIGKEVIRFQGIRVAYFALDKDA